MLFRSTNLQGNVFFFKASISGTVSSGSSGTGHRGSLARGLPGVTVQLQDDSGTVLATTVTDARGHYRFDNFNGIEGTGNYNVRLVVPSGLRQTSASPATILISRGDVNVSGVNFRVAAARQGTSGTDWAGLDDLFTGLWGDRHH